MKRTFEEVEGYDEMIVLRDIRFESHCEHHLAPIIGKAHVGYLPTNRVVGISKLARVVESLRPPPAGAGKDERADRQLHPEACWSPRASPSSSRRSTSA